VAVWFRRPFCQAVVAHYDRPVMVAEPEPTSIDADVSAGPSPGDEVPLPWRRLLAVGMLPLAALFALWLADVPIGQPFFLIYRYSPWWLIRGFGAAQLLLVGGVGLWLVWYAFDPEANRRRRAAAVVGVAVTYALVVAGLFVMVPEWQQQHVFNYLSPSHDGAFVLEASREEFTSVRAYVSEEYYQRLQRSPKEMRGRRVLSNPAGMTVAFRVVYEALRTRPEFGLELARAAGVDDVESDGQRIQFAAILAYAFGLMLIWGASLPLAYRLCRLGLPPPGAAAIAFACEFNPSTVCFSPGKDPAQVLFVVAILWTALAGYLRGRSWWWAVCGAVLAISLSIGLVTAWIMVIAAGATALHAVIDGDGGTGGVGARVRRWCLRSALPAAGGSLAIWLLFWIGWDWNLIRSTVAVGLRYGEIQLPIITDPFYWTLVGLPMFLLFVGPTFYLLIALRWMPWSRSLRGMSPIGTSPETQGSGASSGVPRYGTIATTCLGRYLLIMTALVLVYTYFFANNSETPRLWMPFIPPLLVGLAWRQPVLSVRSQVVRRLCVLLMILQFGGTMLHWSMMDVRESEYRLSTGRLWD
jgi:hypothetical protein